MSAKCVTFVERVSRIPPLHVYSVTLPFGGLVLPAGRRLWYMGMVVEQQRGLICGRRRGRVRGSTAHFQTTDSNFSLSVFAGKKTKKTLFFGTSMAINQSSSKVPLVECMTISYSLLLYCIDCYSEEPGDTFFFSLSSKPTGR